MIRYGRPIPPQPWPTGTRVVPVLLPDDDLWVANFAGAAFDTLSQQQYWQRDPSGTQARDVAAVWAKYADIFAQSYLNEVTTVSCDQIADCVKTDVAVQGEIVGVVNNTIIQPTTPYPGVPGYPAPPMILDSTPVPDSVINPCDYDAMWGAASYLVDEYALQMQQWFEVVEQITNVSEFISLFTAILPGVTGQLVNAVVGFFGFIQDVTTEAWAVADSPANRDYLKCILYCGMKDSCTIDVRTVTQAAYDAWDSLTGQDLSGIVEWYLFLQVLPQQAVWADRLLYVGMFVMIMGAANTAQYIPFIGGNTTIGWIGNKLRVGYLGEASPAWQALCTDCAPPVGCASYTINFTTLATTGLPLGWMSASPPDLPVLTDGVANRWADRRGGNQGLRAEGYPLYGLSGGVDFVYLWAAYDLGDPCVLTRVEIDGLWAGTSNTKSQAVYALRGYTFASRVYLGGNSNGGASSGTPPNFTWSGVLDGATHILIQVFGIVTSNDGSPQLRFTKIN